MIYVYLHLGGDISIYAGDIVGIFDYRLVNSAAFNEFIKFSTWNKRIRQIEGASKSIVITKDTIFFVPVSRATLVRRGEKMSMPVNAEARTIGRRGKR